MKLLLPLMFGSLLLLGCTEAPVHIEGNGVRVTVQGLDGYCAKNPTHKECGGTE